MSSAVAVENLPWLDHRSASWRRPREPTGDLAEFFVPALEEVFSRPVPTFGSAD